MPMQLGSHYNMLKRISESFCSSTTQDDNGLPSQGYVLSANKQIYMRRQNLKVKGKTTHHTWCYDQKSASQQGISLGLLLLDPIQQKALLHRSHIHLSMLQSSEYSVERHNIISLRCCKHSFTHSKVILM